MSRYAEGLPKNEVELCAIAHDWLLLEGWDVHQEVASTGGTIDLLAVRGKLLWAIEAKMRLSFEVCEQALQRRCAVHQVSILIPDRGWTFARQVAERFGFGMLVVRAPYHDTLGNRVHEVVKPSRAHMPAGRDWQWQGKRSQYARNIRNVQAFLSDETRTYAAAGSSGASRWTHFKQFIRETQNLLKQHGPQTTKELYALFADSNAVYAVQAVAPHNDRALYSRLYNGWVPNVGRVSEKPLKWGILPEIGTGAPESGS